LRAIPQASRRTPEGAEADLSAWSHAQRSDRILSAHSSRTQELNAGVQSIEAFGAANYQHILNRNLLPVDPASQVAAAALKLDWWQNALAMEKVH